MDFLNKLGKKASETYKVTTEKTGKLAQEVKLKLKMNENKSQISELYKEIGAKVYEQHIREEKIDIKEELEEQCIKIDVLANEIEEILNQILALKDKKQCEKCFTEININDKFCPACGAEQQMATEEDAREVEVIEKEETSESDSEDVESIEDVVKAESIVVEENKEEN